MAISRGSSTYYVRAYVRARRRSGQGGRRGGGPTGALSPVVQVALSLTRCRRSGPPPGVAAWPSRLVSLPGFDSSTLTVLIAGGRTGFRRVALMSDDDPTHLGAAPAGPLPVLSCFRGIICCWLLLE